MEEAKDTDKISVVMLAYNHAHLIESTVRSVLQQDCTDIELVVSDDCSTDDTWSRLLGMAAADPRLRPIRTPRNLGMAGNANYAVSQTSRPYIALLHHDDLYRHDMVTRWAQVMDKWPEVAFVFNEYAVHGSTLVYRQPMLRECNDGEYFLRTFLMPAWGCPVRGTAMIRRSCWDRVGGMRIRFNLLADIDLWIRLARIGQVGYVAEPLIVVRYNRPDDYPESYKSKGWSWDRQRLLYEIHGAARLEGADGHALWLLLRWWWFRVRLSVETCRWLAYAVVRRKPEMILESERGATAFDLLPLLWIRRRLVRWYAIRDSTRR